MSHPVLREVPDSGNVVGLREVDAIITRADHFGIRWDVSDVPKVRELALHEREAHLILVPDFTSVCVQKLPELRQLVLRPTVCIQVPDAEVHLTRSIVYPAVQASKSSEPGSSPVEW